MKAGAGILVRSISFVLAVLTFAWIVSVAFLKSSLGMIGRLKPMLTLFLHMHKSAGTSIVRMFKASGIRLHRPHKNGNPWTENRQKIIEFWNWEPDKLSALDVRAVDAWN